MRKTDKQNGITLVALVITIIILLILAGISIASLTENGLFEKTKLAKDKTQKGQEKENQILKEYENGIENLGSIISTDRGFSESSIIKDFNIRTETEDVLVQVFIKEENIEDLNKEAIGYIITVDGEGKKVTDTMPATINLSPGQKRNVSVIAIDKELNVKSSSTSCEVAIPNMITNPSSVLTIDNAQNVNYMSTYGGNDKSLVFQYLFDKNINKERLVWRTFI